MSPPNWTDDEGHCHGCPSGCASCLPALPLTDEARIAAWLEWFGATGKFESGSLQTMRSAFKAGWEAARARGGQPAVLYEGDPTAAPLVRFYRCMCGRRFAWTTIAVPRCTRCGACGSDLAEAPHEHEAPVAHDFATKYDQDTGLPFDRCTSCSARRDALVRRNEADTPWSPRNE